MDSSYQYRPLGHQSRTPSSAHRAPRHLHQSSSNSSNSSLSALLGTEAMMPSASDKIGRGLAWVLGIKLAPPIQEARFESSGRVGDDPADLAGPAIKPYFEPEPTVAEWARDILPSGREVAEYAAGLFPVTSWIRYYNVTWLIGDLISAITVGVVLIPQSMAYSSLALLSPEFGLYTAFAGVLTYWIFATSKDVSIGPVAVVSTVTGNIISQALKEVPEFKDHPEIIASSLAFTAGMIIVLLGLCRIGWLANLIPLTAISAFTTGAALTIAVGQLPSMLGLSGFSNRDPTYQVIINIFKHLSSAGVDCGLGVSSLLLLYSIRMTCVSLVKRYPTRQKLFFFLSSLRSSFVIILSIIVSWSVNRNQPKPRLQILGPIPRGFKHIQPPKIDSRLLGSFAGGLPIIVVVLLMEHIAISQSFGRLYNYRINPSQEFIGIGVTNLVGSTLGAYPATGSFSRTAISAKAGVRTPLAGFFASLVVLLAIYTLPAVLCYIPKSSLAAVIVHAVGDLITPPNSVYKFWRVSPFEVPIFLIGVLVTVFSSIELGVTLAILLSAALLLYRIVAARGQFLGTVNVCSVSDDGRVVRDTKELQPVTDGSPGQASAPNHQPVTSPESKTLFLPIDRHDGSNPLVSLSSPFPGIFIYRLSEGYNYPNANSQLESLLTAVIEQTQPTSPQVHSKIADRPWNDANPGAATKNRISEDERPTLKAIILDFSSVNNVDVTSVRHLADIRSQLDRHSAPDAVDWHFAFVSNRWTKRALAAAGFGSFSDSRRNCPTRQCQELHPVAELQSLEGSALLAELPAHCEHRARLPQMEEGIDMKISAGSGTGGEATPIDSVTKAFESESESLSSRARLTAIYGINYPLFHPDLSIALESAIRNSKPRPFG